MTGPILLAYDGSPSAKHAIAQAARLLPGARAIVVFVMEPVLPGPVADPFGVGGPMIDPEQVDEIGRLVGANAEAVAADGAERARAAGLAAEPLAEASRGSTWSTILDVAAEREAELVVVGARGHSRVRSLLLGSVSNGIVHHARLPVLVLPAQQDD